LTPPRHKTRLAQLNSLLAHDNSLLARRVTFSLSDGAAHPAAEFLSAPCSDFEAAVKWQTLAVRLVRQHVPSLLKNKADRLRGVDFEDRLAFYKSKRPLRE
jgi:hypothetical protein